MDREGWQRISPTEWHIAPTGDMRVPAILYADDALFAAMDDKVREQLVNVTKLPGIVKAAYAMPDAHWGYGFPIGGVAAFDPQAGGIISAGGVGFDISCGVRTLLIEVQLLEIFHGLGNAGHKQKPPGRWQPADEQLEHGSFLHPQMKIGLPHRELVKIQQKGSAC